VDALDRDVDERQEGAHQQNVRHHRIEQEHRAAFVAADLADDHGHERAADRGRQRRDMAEGELRCARTQHDEHADEADDDRPPAMDADPFAEDRDRKNRDEHRRGEEDCIDLGQRKGREGIEGAAGDEDRARRAQCHPPGMHRDERSARLVAHQHKGDQRERQERAEEHDLERREGATELLDEGVVRRIEGERR
jgi:hypothetical protein